ACEEESGLHLRVLSEYEVDWEGELVTSEEKHCRLIDKSTKALANRVEGPRLAKWRKI
ncbi:Hypothetical protein FKW44_015078, partial [Caligus rogercresseyi]